MTFTITMTHEQFNRALNLASHAMSKEETRYYLNGICFDDGKMIATDGHRLCAVDVPIEGDASERPIMPSNMVKQLLKQKPGLYTQADVTLSYSDETFTVTYETGATFTGKAIVCPTSSGRTHGNGTFPEWRRAVPEDTSPNGVLPIGLNPKYIADLSKAMTAAGMKSQTIRIETQSEYDEETGTGHKGASASPMILNIGEKDVLIVLMPRRL